MADADSCCVNEIGCICCVGAVCDACADTSPTAPPVAAPLVAAAVAAAALVDTCDSTGMK